MDNSLALFLCSLFLSLSILNCFHRIDELEKEIEIIGDVCKWENY